MNKLPIASLLLAALLLTQSLLAQGSAAPPAPADPAAVLARARDVMGFSKIQNRIIHYHAITASEQPYQSDRTYPPFFSAMSDQETWLDANSGVLRVQSQTIFPGAGPSAASITVDDGTNIQVLRGEQGTAISRAQAQGRYLSPWMVIRDWSVAKDVRIAGTENYRDYPRLVLERGTPQGPQRLFVDAKSGFPVKLDMVEPHYLWGQRHLEFVWSTWVLSGGISLPGSVFRVADGEVETSQTLGAIDLVSADKAPALAPLPRPAQPPPDLPLFLRPIPPKTVQVGANTWLLTNPGYNEIVTLAGGDIYIFDATQGEDRARLDAAEIAKLFPGSHKINLIVTDLAWPHLAGLRYWVAQGATIVSHPTARDFLQSVVDRHWTLAPDSLEQKRKQNPESVKLHFVAAGEPTTLAGGAVRVLPIDGIGSEIALMAYLPSEKFLWASDYIQKLDEPSFYAAEVLRAAERAGIEPQRFAAEHISVSDWQQVRSAQQPK